jgi:hypothetical protein
MTQNDEGYDLYMELDELPPDGDPGIDLGDVSPEERMGGDERHPPEVPDG